VSIHSMKTLIFYISLVTDELILKIDFNLLNKAKCYDWNSLSTISNCIKPSLLEPLGFIYLCTKLLLTAIFLQCEYIWLIQKYWFQILQCSAIMAITFPLNGRTTNVFNIRNKTQWLQVSSYTKVKNIEHGFI